MAVTTTATLADSIQTLHDPNYRMEVRNKAVWGQFDTLLKAMNGQRSTTVQLPLYELIEPATGTLSQTADETPETPTDSSANVTLSDYGNAIQFPDFLKATALTDIERVIRDVVAQNSLESQEILRRDVYVGGTQVLRGPNRLAARTDLDATNDLVSYAFLSELMLRAQGASWDDAGSFVTVVRPELLRDMQAMAQWDTRGQNIDPSILLTGEVGRLHNFRFMASPFGKVYLSGGTTAQAATTISASVADGDTTCAVASATGLTAGDYITIGTLEATNSEEVQITTVSGTDLTIVGAGNSMTNAGFAYSHASAAAVTESAAVYALPIIGKDAVWRVYSDITGPDGKLLVTGPFDALGRFLNIGWHAITGWGRGLERYLVRGEVAGSIKPIATFRTTRGRVGG